MLLRFHLERVKQNGPIPVAALVTLHEHSIGRPRLFKEHDFVVGEPVIPYSEVRDSEAAYLM